MATATITTAAPTDLKLLSSREAAQTLGISTRTLWSLTNCGEISSVRIGRSVKYSNEHIRQYVERNTTSR